MVERAHGPEARATEARWVAREEHQARPGRMPVLIAAASVGAEQAGTGPVLAALAERARVGAVVPAPLLCVRARPVPPMAEAARASLTCLGPKPALGAASEQLSPAVAEMMCPVRLLAETAGPALAPCLRPPRESARLGMSDPSPEPGAAAGLGRARMAVYATQLSWILASGLECRRSPARASVDPYPQRAFLSRAMTESTGQSSGGKLGRNLGQNLDQNLDQKPALSFGQKPVLMLGPLRPGGIEDPGPPRSRAACRPSALLSEPRAVQARPRPQALAVSARAT